MSVRFALNGTDVVPEFASKTWVGKPENARIGIIAAQAEGGGAKLTSLEVRRLDDAGE